jgi:transcription factor TGA
MSFFQQKQPQLVSSPFSSSIFGNISLLDRISQQQEANKALLGEAKVMESDMRLQSMDETLSDQEQDDSQSDKMPQTVSDFFGRERRLAQNREAARKSRLRKKAYVQQLEASRIRLQQLEEELQQARRQGLQPHATTAPVTGAPVNPAVAAFDLEYVRWVEEQQRTLADTRTALQNQVSDGELKKLVDKSLAHYDTIFRLKSEAAKADVFHLMSGTWKTPAERCFLWMGGFRPSEMLKILIPQIEPLTEAQLLSVCNLQQQSQQAEDALSQGMEALQQSLADTLSTGSISTVPNMANYMGQMAIAMGKLGALETFVRQADSLRQQMLQQMAKVLNTRQTAQGLLAMGDYFSRLRALSSLWSARPHE